MPAKAGGKKLRIGDVSQKLAINLILIIVRNVI